MVASGLTGLRPPAGTPSFFLQDGVLRSARRVRSITSLSAGASYQPICDLVG